MATYNMLKDKENLEIKWARTQEDFASLSYAET